MGIGDESTMAAGGRVQNNPSQDDTLVAPDSMGTGGEQPFDRIPPPHAIEQIAHYKVLEPIGEGGMGLIFAAEDQKLQRKVAVKLVRAMHGDRQSAQARLMREAQALAQVNHPNVIHVYEVGTFGDQVFVAMEYVDGETLRSWQWREHISWRAILDAYLAAGRGLAAAHAKGLVHRDFKPDNVLITRDRKVRVIDFGLARAQENEIRLDLEDSLAQRKTDLRQPLTRLTETGTLMGTPAYMAPEQHTGDPTDHRTDQFAFCVAVYEALYGMRPFAGETYAELVGNVLRGEVEDEPRFVRVPPATRKVLLRGLSTAPDRRYPSMEALLTDLRRDPQAWIRRAPWIAGAIVIAGLLLFGWWTVSTAFERAGEAAEVRADLARHRVAQLEGARTETAQLRNRLVLGRARELLAHDPTTALSLLRLLDAELPPGPAAAAIVRESLRYGVRGRVVVPPDGEVFTQVVASQAGDRFVATAGPNLLVLDDDGAVVQSRVLPFAPELLAGPMQGGFVVAGRRDLVQLVPLLDRSAALRAVPLVPDSHVTALAVSADGGRLALGFQSGVIEVWSTVEDVETPRARLVDQHAPIRALDFDETGEVLVSGSDDGEVFRWDLVSNKHRSTTFDSRTITSVRASQNHDVLVLDSQGRLSAWMTQIDGKSTLATDVAVADIRRADTHGWFALGTAGRGKGSSPARIDAEPRGLAFGTDGRVVVLDAEGRLQFWAQVDEDSHVVSGHSWAPVAMQTIAGDRVVSASASGVVAVIELHPLRVSTTVELNGTVFALAAEPTGSKATVTVDIDGVEGTPTMTTIDLDAAGSVHDSVAVWPAQADDLRWVDGEVVRLACSATGCGLETGAGHEHRVDIDRYASDSAPTLRASQDGQWLRATRGREVALIDRIESVTHALDWLGPRPDRVVASDFGTRGGGGFRVLTSSDESMDRASGRIVLWQWATSSPRMHTVEGFETQHFWVDEDRSGIVFEDVDGELHAWPLTRPAPTKLPFDASLITRVVFGPHARHVAVEIGGANKELWVVELEGKGFARYSDPGTLWFLIQNGVVAEYRDGRLVMRGLEGDLSARALQERVRTLVSKPPSLRDLLPSDEQ